MDSKQLRSGAVRRARPRSWHFPLVLAIGGSLVLACGTEDKGGTGPEPGIAAALELFTAPPASAATRAVLSPAPVIQVVDVNGDPVDTAGLLVTAGLASGSGTLTGTTTATTDGNGRATFGNLAIQGLIGTKSIGFSASQVTGVQATGLSLTAGAAATLTANSTTSQTGGQGQPVGTKPSVKASDLDGNGVAGVGVTFAITAGAGSLTGGGQTTNSNGIATVGSWTLDAAAGLNTMTATAAGLGGSPQTFNATGTAVASQFTIELQFLLPPSPGQQVAFQNAKAKWEQLIIGDVSDITVNIPADPSCGNVPIQGAIDDVRILVLLDSIDGPSGILGAAGPCYIRGAGLLTLAGIMNFDTADVAALEASGALSDVILHEMGHVLGYGTLWSNQGKLIGSGTSNPTFSGISANAAYLTEGGSVSVTPTFCEAAGGGRGAVPVENSGGGGTANSHWEECIFRSEIMTGFISGSVRPVSKTTVQSMADLGYTVNVTAADAFSLATQPTLRASEDTGPVFELGHDVLSIPIRIVDASGRVIGTLR